MTTPGLLIVVSGPSGTGKGTICRTLLDRRPDVFISVSATTRPPRRGEVDGTNYFFLTKEKFEDMLARDEFLEWAEVYDNYYGTPRQPVQDALAAGKDILLEIDIQGALKVKEKMPQGAFIFIVPPSLETLKSRIIGRGTDSMEVITKRMNKALGELTKYEQYDYIIVNDVLEDAVDRVNSIITAEKCRAKRYRFAGDQGLDDLLIVPR